MKQKENILVINTQIYSIDIIQKKKTVGVEFSICDKLIQ